jgi:hypothetical protein
MDAATIAHDIRRYAHEAGATEAEAEDVIHYVLTHLDYAGDPGHVIHSSRPRRSPQADRLRFLRGRIPPHSHS